MSTELVPVSIPFQGGGIAALQDPDTGLHHIAVRQACEAMGVDYSSQLKRLKRQPWATVVIMTILDPRGRRRETCTLDPESFLMWLGTIDSSRIKNEQARDLIVRYQIEASAAIRRHFLGAPSPPASRQLEWSSPPGISFKSEVLKELQGPDVPDKAREVAVRLEQEKRGLGLQGIRDLIAINKAESESGSDTDSDGGYRFMAFDPREMDDDIPGILGRRPAERRSIRPN